MTSSNNTETNETSETPAVEEMVETATPETSGNLADTDTTRFVYFNTEMFILNRSDNSYTHTCVGESTAIDGHGREVTALTMFDMCSTDSWVTEECSRKIDPARLILGDPWGKRTLQGPSMVKIDISFQIGL